MHIGYAGKSAFMSGIGYSAKGAGLGIHAVGTGFVKAGTFLQSAGDTLTEFGNDKIKTGKACWLAATSNCDPTKMTDEDLKNTGLSDKEVAEIRAAQAQVVNTTAPAETKKTEPAKKEEPAGETIEVTASEAAAMLC